MATEAVTQVDFIEAGYMDSIDLCAEMVELRGDDAVGASVDASVLEAAPVPEGSLIPISEITASVAQAKGDADGKNTPRVAIRLMCSDSRICDVDGVTSCVDPSTGMERVHVWVLRVTRPGGAALDYRFRARSRSVVSLQTGSRWVYAVFLYSYDARPTVTEPKVGAAGGAGRGERAMAVGESISRFEAVLAPVLDEIGAADTRGSEQATRVRAALRKLKDAAQVGTTQK